MRCAELEKYIGKNVSVKLFDGYVYNGELHKTGEEEFKDDPNFSIPKNYYFLTTKGKPKRCISCLFRCSHINHIELL